MDVSALKEPLLPNSSPTGAAVRPWLKRALPTAFAVVLSFSPTPAHASPTGEIDGGAQAAAGPAERADVGMDNVAETEAAGVSVVLDEHLLVDAKRDMDYNGGGEVTFSGDRANVRWLDFLLGGIDSSWGSSDGRWTSPMHALAAGLLVFTPGDLNARAVVSGDRPYASLFFLSGDRLYVAADGSIAYNSSLTIGVLGLAAARGVQDALHDITDSTRPEGWSHQISAGGEPTARYSLARGALIGSWDRADLKWTLVGSAGTVTEGSVALNLRWGRIASPWWSSTPELNTYIQDPKPALPPLPRGLRPELFLLVGARSKLRVYNAFLEGQFRHSDLRYSLDSMNVALGEAWVGVEFRNSSGLELRYMTRWESPELRTGVGSRTIVWGSVELAQSF